MTPSIPAGSPTVVSAEQDQTVKVACASPSRKPVENLWNDVDKIVREAKRSNMDELEKAVIEGRGSISIERCRKQISSMPARWRTDWGRRWPSQVLTLFFPNTLIKIFSSFIRLFILGSISENNLVLFSCPQKIWVRGSSHSLLPQLVKIDPKVIYYSIQHRMSLQTHAKDAACLDRLRTLLHLNKIKSCGPI